MPDAAHRECHQPGCPKYALAHGFCSDHLHTENTNPRLTTSNRRFRSLRHSFLVRHPVCAMCRTEPGTVLDHVIPHRGIPTLFWSQHNWQALCIRCHGIKTAREMWGRVRKWGGGV